MNKPPGQKDTQHAARSTQHTSRPTHHAPINGLTQLTGIIGWPVSHSFSPAMHNAAFADLQMNWAYVPLPVPPEQLETAVRGLRALGFRGANVTVPHKQTVMPFLDDIEAGARAIGAVNTIVVKEDGRLTGYNTDWSGFLADLAALAVAVRGRDCLVLGAGGSARAVVYALGQAGGNVRVLARRPSQAAQLVEDLRPYTQTTLTAHPLTDLPSLTPALSHPLILNTTPLGMTPHEEISPWPGGLSLPAGAFVYDLVYNPRQTRFMQQAEAAGCAAANGLGMLLRQGALAFTLWTGQEPSLAVMQDALA